MNYLHAGWTWFVSHPYAMGAALWAVVALLRWANRSPEESLQHRILDGIGAVLPLDIDRIIKLLSRRADDVLPLPGPDSDPPTVVRNEAPTKPD